MGRMYGRMGTFYEDKTRCVIEVWEAPSYIYAHQCRRKRGHGPDDLYCKQHGKMATPKPVTERPATYDGTIEGNE